MSKNLVSLPLNFVLSKITSMMVRNKDGEPEYLLDAFPDFHINVVSEENKKQIYLTGLGSFSVDIDNPDKQMEWNVNAEGYEIPATPQIVRSDNGMYSVYQNDNVILRMASAEMVFCWLKKSGAISFVEASEHDKTGIS